MWMIAFYYVGLVAGFLFGRSVYKTHARDIEYYKATIRYHEKCLEHRGELIDDLRSTVRTLQLERVTQRKKIDELILKYHVSA